MFDPYANIRKLVQTPAHLMRTFQIDQPIASHFRPASCQEVSCAAHAHGWKMGFDLSDPDKLAAARQVRDRSGRSFTTEVTGVAPNQRVVFTFPAGQQCFVTHHVPLEREPFYTVRGGDFRGNPERRRYQHGSADSFVDQWETDLDKLKTVHERG